MARTAWRWSRQGGHYLLWLYLLWLFLLMALLKSSRLFGGALTLHLAAVAARCTERRVPPGARFCRAGETYLVCYLVITPMLQHASAARGRPTS